MLSNRKFQERYFTVIKRNFSWDFTFNLIKIDFSNDKNYENISHENKYMNGN